MIRTDAGKGRTISRLAAAAPWRARDRLLRSGRDLFACRQVVRHCLARRVTRTLSRRFVVREGARSGALTVVYGDGAARKRECDGVRRRWSVARRSVEQRRPCTARLPHESWWTTTTSVESRTSSAGAVTASR